MCGIRCFEAIWWIAELAVELSGVLRPSWFAWFYGLLPIAFWRSGPMPRVELRWAIIGLAALMGPGLLGSRCSADRRRERGATASHRHRAGESNWQATLAAVLHRR